MNNIHVASVVTENASSVSLKCIWDSNTASDWSTLRNLLHHVLLAAHSAKLIDSVHKVLVRDEACLSWTTVSAELHGRALLAVVVATCLVNRASSVSDLVVGHPSKSIVGFTSVAAQIRGFARDQGLWRDVNVWPSSVSGDLDSVRKGRGGSVGPAGSAVGWDVLVEHVCQEVSAILAIPEYLLWKILNMLESLSNSWLNSVWIANAARGTVEAILAGDSR